jgi:ATP-dependent Clp protease ATP-binding subunit ClpC
VFERFTDRARRAVVLAQEEARVLDHDYIGTEHLLLGLIAEGDGIAARTLDELEIRPEAVREEIEALVGRGEGSGAQHIPFTGRAKKVLELALREALQLGHNYIGTEHILLGLLRESDGVAAQVLVRLGADLERVRETVTELLERYGQAVVAGRYVEAGEAGDIGEVAEAREPGDAVETGEVGEAGAALHPAPLRRPERLPVHAPTCPSCRASLTEWLRVRTLEATTEDDETEPVRIAFCGRCGAALQVVA